MVLLYVHQYVQMQVKVKVGEDANRLRLAASLLVSLLAYQAIVQFSITRILSRFGQGFAAISAPTNEDPGYLGMRI